MDAPPNRGSVNSAHIFGTHVPVEEPSTASTADLDCGAAKRCAGRGFLAIDYAPSLSARSFKSFAIMSTGTFGDEGRVPGPNSSGLATAATRNPAAAAPLESSLCDEA